MLPFLIAVLALQLLIAWTWFWPRSWWDRMRQLPAIGYQGTTDLIRSLIAFSISIWLLIGILYLVFSAYGHNQPPALIVVPIMAPLLIWISVMFFGYPQFLVPPGARQDEDAEAVELVREFPLVWLGFGIGFVGLCVFALWAKAHHL
jgi:hypothetical protein